MRHIISKLFCVLCAVCGLTACVDNDYQSIVQEGDPTIVVAAIDPVQMGDKIEFAVNCSDKKGTALSTLKAELCFSDEVVADTIIRTKTEGDYDVSLNVPFLRYIPNGDIKVRLTLQNVTTSKTIVDVTTQAERPHFDNLMFVDAEGNTYPMSEGDDYNYSANVNITHTGFKGHFATADSKWIFGNDGSEITLGGTGNVDFQSENTGEIEVTFNARDYTYGPCEEISITPLMFTESDNVITRNMVKGRIYAIGGIVADDWFIDNDFFEKNDDNTYTFIAIDGEYTLTAYNNYKFMQVFAGKKDAPATLQDDGSGALWIIGSNGINKPLLSSSNNNGWWTGTEWDQAMAQIRPKVYQITLTVGEQLSASDVNFKFFGQPDWGTEFKGDGSDHSLTCDSEVFGVGDGNGHDNGNVYLKDGVTLKDGDTYVFTVDLTAGCANGKLSVKKNGSGGVQELTLADKEPVVMTIKKGTKFQLGGVVNDDWFVDNDFLKKNADGTYTFLCVSGTYAIKAYATHKYVQIYPANEDGTVATLQADGTGSIWIIGSVCVNKPLLTSANNAGWTTEIENDQCLAPVAAKKYRITLTVGKQLSASDINFKFFGQPTWGIEFNGLGGDYHIDSDNEWFRVNAADSDNGNIFLKDGAKISDGDTFVFTIDLTNGVKNGVLTVDKK
ncbi:MAG: DUF5121 domain-containing protein [Prevotella sp.]